MTTSGKMAEAAATIRAEAQRLGVTVTGHDGIVTVRKTFTPGDKAAYVTAESDCYAILRHFRMVRAGSVWGTDSGSVGGAVGLEGGYCVLNMSGVAVRLVRALG